MYISRLQFKAKGPDFHTELIPVHSPLLRESCLVSCPPLTYMLKFSGFADLTSCLGNRTQDWCWTAGLYLPECDNDQETPEVLNLLHIVKQPQTLSTSGADEHTLMHKHTLTSDANPQSGILNHWKYMARTLKQACFQGYPESAVYVQVPIDSRNSAVHNAYHTSLCPSSLIEPRHQSPKVKNKI